MTTKVCYKCKNNLSINNFHKQSRSTDGLGNVCKNCKRIQDKEYREQNKEKIDLKSKEYRKNNKEKIALKDKKYSEQNKEVISKKRKEYRERNKEQLAERRKQKYHSASEEEIALRKKKKKDYLKNAPEHVKQRKREYDKKYFASERGKNVLKNSLHKRRAQMLSSCDNTITLDALENLVKEQNYTCKWCNKPLNYELPKQIHLDHIIPLAKGGIHSIDNVCWSCASCNFKKSSKLPDEFIVDLNA